MSSEEDTPRTALFLFAPGVEETELVATVDMLRRGGVRCTLATTTPGVVNASRNVTLYIPEAAKDHLDTSFDAVVLPGGMDNVTTLLEIPSILQYIRTAWDHGVLIGAICAAPLILERCGILDHLDAFTSHPAVRERFSEGLLGRYSERRVVVSGHVVTSRGPGTACEFGLHLIHLLRGPKIADAVNRGVLAQY